jgi:hypothetical protein
MVKEKLIALMNYSVYMLQAIKEGAELSPDPAIHKYFGIIAQQVEFS